MFYHELSLKLKREKINDFGKNQRVYIYGHDVSFLITVQGVRYAWKKNSISNSPLDGWLRHVKRYGRERFEERFFF